MRHITLHHADTNQTTRINPDHITRTQFTVDDHGETTLIWRVTNPGTGETTAWRFPPSPSSAVAWKIARKYSRPRHTDDNGIYACFDQHELIVIREAIHHDNDNGNGKPRHPNPAHLEAIRTRIQGALEHPIRTTHYTPTTVKKLEFS